MKTKTIFRIYPNGDVIALFPEIKELNGCCMSYMHIGQHGAADYNHVVASTALARYRDFADLLTELKSIGYDPLIKVRRSRGK